MTSLEDIWDAPIEPRSPRQNAVLENEDSNIEELQRRKKEPLFLADSDSDHPAPKAPKRRRSVNEDIDIDAHFADINDDDETLVIKPLGPDLDTEALRKEAEARYARIPALTPREILPSSSPPREKDGEDGKTKGKRTDSKEEQKTRRKPMKLDEGRLLSQQGFPQLIKDVKDFRIKGKGHEAADLDRLLRVYQFWTHRLYPKTQFRDTVERVEKLCHSRRMNVALSVWRDEFHGKTPAERSEAIDLTDSDDDLSADGHHGAKFDQVASIRNSTTDDTVSREPSQPPTSSSEPDYDDFDIDAVIREEEERRAKEKSQSNDTAAPKASYRQGDSAVMNIDEDEEIWDDIMKGAFDNLPGANEGGNSLISGSSGTDPITEDEDMLDVIREMENEEVVVMTAGPHPKPTHEQRLTEGANVLSVEGDWEDMYV